jgi:mTERF domain-containing protein
VKDYLVDTYDLTRPQAFIHEALQPQAVAFLSKEKITTKVDYLKKMFRWSDAEVSIALTRAPMLLRRSKDMLQRRSQFLISEVWLELGTRVHCSSTGNYMFEPGGLPQASALHSKVSQGKWDP